MVNIIRGVLLGVLLFFVARRYGINGTLVATLCVVLVTDFFYFTYRLYKLGYLRISLIRSTLYLWSMIIPAGFLIAWGCKALVAGLFTVTMYIPRILVSAGCFTIAFVLLLLSLDAEIRDMVKILKEKFFTTPDYKLRKV